MRGMRGIEHEKDTGLTSENVLTLLCARYARYAALYAHRELIRRTKSQEFKSTAGQAWPLAAPHHVPSRSFLSGIITREFSLRQ